MTTGNANNFVSVVIPFFQKEQGLLKRCVESILAQKGFDNYQIIVVDDSSPISASSELDDLLVANHKIKVVKQANAGPGAARNTGLNHVSDQTDYIALMDSDDWWEDNYLLTATQTLDMGYDLFFANTVRDEIAGNRFEWHKKKNLDLKPEDHKLIDQDQLIYEFTGDFFNYSIVRSNIIATSSTIFRRSCYPTLRFNTKLYNGQDRLFKLSLCQKLNKVAFTPQILVHECKGLNIFDNAQWGSPDSLRLLYNYINLSKTILDELELSEAHRAQIKQQLDESRYSMFASLAHLVKSKVKIDWSIIGKTLKEDPVILGYMVPYSCKVLFKGLQNKPYQPN